MIIRFLISLLIALLAGGGCGLIYKQNIQQGNAIEQDDLDELYIGMNQRQVLFVLGTPSVRDPFHQDRWDYVQTFSRRGSPMVMRTVTLHFEDGLLSEIDGQDSPFGAGSGQVTGDASEVASFVKRPSASSGGSDEGQSPQDQALESAEEEVREANDPDIKAVRERSAEDRDYQQNMEVLDQTPDDDPTRPDIDG